MIIHLAQINVEDRIREDYGKDAEFGELCESIRRHGFLNAIVLERKEDGKLYLRAGERRYLAARKIYANEGQIPYWKSDEEGNVEKDFLPPGTVRAEVVGDLTPEQALIIEFEENERRKDFTFQERAKYIRRMHEAMTKRYPDKWTQKLTAELLNVTPASISYYLKLDQIMEENPEVAKAETMQAAIKRAKRVEQLKVRRLEVSKDPKREKNAKEILHFGDGIKWLQSLPDSSVDLVHLDPPWGDETSRKSAENWEGFDDSTEYSDKLVPQLLTEAYRVLRDDRFCVLWYRQWGYDQTCRTVEAAGFSLKFGRTPCIWYKPDKVSDQNRFPEKQLIDAYETFLIVRKGEPVFRTTGAQNVFAYARVPRSELIHPTQKPVGLLVDLFKILTLPGERVIDPTAGSASSLIAAYKALRKPQGCELMKVNYERALTWLAEVVSL